MDIDKEIQIFEESSIDGDNILKVSCFDFFLMKDVLDRTKFKDFLDDFRIRTATDLDLYDIISNKVYSYILGSNEALNENRYDYKAVSEDTWKQTCVLIGPYYDILIEAFFIKVSGVYAFKSENTSFDESLVMDNEEVLANYLIENIALTVIQILQRFIYPSIFSQERDLIETMDEIKIEAN